MIGLEVCVDSAAGLAAAASLPVARIELCGALSVGGITPPAGLVAAARDCPVPVYAMIRPREGGFVFSPAEEAAMQVEIASVREAGLAGVVLGAALPDGRLDAPMLNRLLASCGGLGRTLHRVIDLVPEPLEALETAIGLGFERVLSAGGAVRASDGAAALYALVRAANGRIGIMAGSGVTSDTVAALVARTGVGEVHASCRPPPAPDGEGAAAGFGFGGGAGPADRIVIASMLQRLNSIAAGHDYSSAASSGSLRATSS